MQDLLLWLFPLTHYPNAVMKRRAAGTYLGAVLIFVGCLALLGAALASGGSLSTNEWLFGAAFIVVPLAVLGMTRLAAQKPAAMLLLVLLTLLSGALVFTNDTNESLGLVTAMFGISLAALVIGEQAVYAVAGISA